MNEKQMHTCHESCNRLGLVVREVCAVLEDGVGATHAVEHHGGHEEWDYPASVLPAAAQCVLRGDAASAIALGARHGLEQGIKAALSSVPNAIFQGVENGFNGTTARRAADLVQHLDRDQLLALRLHVLVQLLDDDIPGHSVVTAHVHDLSTGYASLQHRQGQVGEGGGKHIFTCLHSYLF